MARPNFILIGTGRSGSTSIYHYLRQHPEIFMSPVKEPAYFLSQAYPPPYVGPGASSFGRGHVTDWKEYEALFADAGDAKAIGEATANYISFSGVAEHVHRALPDARIVAILRQPAERIHASFVSHRSGGLERLATLEEALADEPRRASEGWTQQRYGRLGYYAADLAEFCALFGADRVGVFLYQDLEKDAGAVMQRMYRFLDVDPEFVPETGTKHNRTPVIENRTLRAIWGATDDLRSRMRPYLPARVRHLAAPLLARGHYRKRLDPERRRILTRPYRDDIRELERMFGLDLSEWVR